MPQIIAQVLEEHDIQSDAYRFHLGTTYPERDYCTQYDETDLHFIQRLAEEEGLSYHFQYSDQPRLLVFGDDQTVFPKLPPWLISKTPAWWPIPRKRFGPRLATRTSRVTRRDYDYPGRFTDRVRGKQLATRALERHRSNFRLAEGKSDQPLLVSGHFLP